MTELRLLGGDRSIPQCVQAEVLASSSEEGLIALLAREDEDRLTAGRIETLVGSGRRTKGPAGAGLKHQDVVAALDLYGLTVVKGRSQPGNPIATLIKCPSS